MIDYSICLIEMQKAIKGYREALLKNNEKKALKHSADLMLWSVRLNNCTVDNFTKDRECIETVNC